MISLFWFLQILLVRDFEQAFNEIALNTISRVISSVVSSMAFLIDGNDNWSIGVKLNVTNSLFDQNNIIPITLKSLFKWKEI